MTEFQREILKAISVPGAVLWPRMCEGVTRYGPASDSRVHFQAPVDDAFALFHLKYINAHGEITDAGRAALSAGQSAAVPSKES